MTWCWIPSTATAQNIDYLVVCADGLSAAAQALCSHRETILTHSYGAHPLNAYWFTVGQIDQDFGNRNNCTEDEEVREFVRTVAPQYLVLLGTKGAPGDPPLGFVPLHNQGVQQTDDYYGDLNDDWLPDIAVGRLPCKNDADASALVAKIIEHDTESWDGTGQEWRARTVFSGYDIDHEGIGGVCPGRRVREYAMFVREALFTTSMTDCGQSSAGVASVIGDYEAREALTVAQVNEGVGVWLAFGTYANTASLVEYLDSASFAASSLDNEHRYPMLFGLSCLLGGLTHSGSTARTLVEDMLLTGGKGIVGAIGPYEAVDQGTIRDLGTEVWREMAKNKVDGYWPIGQALRAAKVAMLTAGVYDDATIHATALLGDPAMCVPFRGDLLQTGGIDAVPPAPEIDEYCHLTVSYHDPSHDGPPYTDGTHVFHWTCDRGNFSNLQQSFHTTDAGTGADWICDSYRDPDCRNAGTASISVHAYDAGFGCSDDVETFDLSYREHVMPPPGGCPVLERTEQGQWRELNNVLAQCAYDTASGMSDDYLMFPEAPMPGFSPLEFRLRELSSGELAEIDLLELLVVDHDPDSVVTVDQDGVVRVARDRRGAVGAWNEQGADVLEQLETEADQHVITVSAGDSLLCVFGDSMGVLTEADLVIRGKEKLELAIDSGPGGVMWRQVGGVDSSYSYVYPRKEWYTERASGVQCTRGDGYADSVLISFNEHHQVDYVALEGLSGAPAATVIRQVGQATHTGEGVVTSRVAHADAEKVDLVEGEELLFGFGRPPLASGMVRHLVLHTRGRYSLTGQGARAAGFETPWGILSIWPNPSRGLAAVLINCAKGEGVLLDVFDVAGRRVRRIEYPNVAGGQHLATWDGADESGRLVGNGIYFIRMTEGNRTTSRKLMVLR